MSQATNQSRSNRTPKRVRTDPTIMDGSDKSAAEAKSKSPTKVAEQALDSMTALLQDSLQKLSLHFGRKILTTRSKLSTKKNIAKRLEDEATYVPRSAKASSFTLSLSKAAEALDAEKVTFRQGQIDQARSTYELTLKNVVQEAIALEIQALQAEERKLVAEFLPLLAKAINTNEGVETTDPHLKVVNLLELNPQVIRYSTFEGVDDFKEKYKTIHTLESIPTRTLLFANGTYHNDQDRARALAQAAASSQRRENKGMSLFNQAASAVLIHPTKAYCDQEKANNREIALKKLATEIISGKATEDTAMELEEEGTASIKTIKELIQKETDARYKAATARYNDLERKYNKLQRDLANQNTEAAPKNPPQRGRQGASNKKKSEGTQQQQPTARNNPQAKTQRGRQNSRGRNERAEESNNDTQSGSSKKRGGRSKSKSAKRRSRSKTGQNKQQR